MTSKSTNKTFQRTVGSRRSAEGGRSVLNMKMIKEYLEKRRIRKMMSEYISPETVDKILAVEVTKKIVIELTNDEALVLFNLLSRLEQMNAIPAEDSEEEKIFRTIQTQLEDSIKDSSDPDILDRIEAAKARLQKKK